MKIRKCKKCNKDVEVEKQQATVVVCDECLIKQGDCPRGKRDYDTDEFIYCRICDVVKRRLDLHIQKVHKITLEEYLNQFKGAPLFSKAALDRKLNRTEESRKKTSDALKKSWANPEVKERRVKLIQENPPFKGHKHSLESKIKISKTSDFRNSVKGYRKDINYPVRSINEANMCRILDYCCIKYEFESKYFDLQDGTILLLDFVLHEDFEMIPKGYLELKGWKKKDGYFSNKEKFDIFQELYPNEYIKLTMMFSSSKESRYLEQKYKTKIPMWETTKKNLKSHPEVYGINQQNIKENWTEFIVCPLCIREGEGEIRSRQKFINYLHLAQHGYTTEKFRKEFPDQLMKIESLGVEHSLIFSGSNHPLFGKQRSQETRRKISEGVLRHNNE